MGKSTGVTNRRAVCSAVHETRR